MEKATGEVDIGGHQWRHGERHTLPHVGLPRGDHAPHHLLHHSLFHNLLHSVGHDVRDHLEEEAWFSFSLSVMTTVHIDKDQLQRILCLLIATMQMH